MAAEKQFENKIKGLLKESGAWFIKYWAGSKFTKEGIPDILACVNGRFVAIEVKAPNGRASELQKYNVKKINNAGGYAVILYPKDFGIFKDLVNCLIKEDDKRARKLTYIIDKEV